MPLIFSIKNTSFLRKSLLALIVLFTPTLTLNSPLHAIPRPTSSLIKDSPKEVIDQVWQIVYRDYLDSSGDYDEVSWLKLRKAVLSRKYNDLEESYEAIRTILSSLKDPYTRFLDPREFKEMKIDTSGELTGVGIQLSVDKSSNEVVVVSPIEGTPAFRAGVKPKDVITSIDSISTKGMSIEEVVRLIRGKKGTKVELGIRRNNKVILFPMVRDKIEILVVHSQLNKTKNGTNIGYIRLKQFNANASKEMSNTIKEFEKKDISGYVLDLRSNPGGLLESSVDIARQWLNEGTIVSTQTKNGIKDIRKANGRALTKMPLVVLVNEGSASASEILSGAIQDNKRGFLVGEKTFGKGLVQSVRTLSDGSGLTVTIAKYLTPKGTDIHKNGIIPDVLANVSEDEMSTLTINDIGTYKDKQYRIGENILLKSIKVNNINRTFNPFSSNIQSALIRPFRNSN